MGCEESQPCVFWREMRALGQTGKPAGLCGPTSITGLIMCVRLDFLYGSLLKRRKDQTPYADPQETTQALYVKKREL